MIDQGIKTSPSLLPRKKELQNIRRTGLISKVGPRFNKSKPEWQTNKKIFDCSIAPASTDENPFENQKKLNCSELTQLKQETSEEVQEFIKQVSDFIKKKNFDAEAARNDGSNSIGSIQFNGMGRKPPQKKHPETLKLEGGCEILPTEKVKDYMGHPKLREKLYSAGTFGKEPKILKGKQFDDKTKTMISLARKRDQNEKFSQKIKKTEPKTIKKPTNEYFYANMNDETNVEYSRSAEIRQRNKKKRKSEIPLRKNRTYSAKPVSWLLHKPSSENESSISFDFCPDAKSFLPPKETNFCSYVGMSNVDTIKEHETNKSYDEHTPVNTKRSKSYLTSMTIVNSESTDKLLVDKPLNGENVLEIEKVTTSSFSNFRADNVVLRRLESFHKQNISSKETKVSLKPRTLAPKASFNSLAGKSSKKSVSTRLSSKGNKPGLKLKMKKNQLWDPKEPKRLRKCCEEKMKVLELEKHENVFFKFPRSEILKKDDVQQHRKVTSSRAKLSLNHLIPPKDEEKFDTTNRSARSFIELEKGNFENVLIEKNQQNIKNSPSSKNCDNEVKKPGSLVNDDVTPAFSLLMPINVDAKNNDNRSVGEKEDDDGWSSKTIIFDEKSSSEKLCVVRLDTKNQDSNVLTKGTSLTFNQDEPPKEPDEAESLATNKKMLKIDLSSLELTEPVTMEEEIVHFSFEWDLPKIEKEEDFCPNEGGIENRKEKEKKTSRDVSVDSLSSEVTEEPVPLNAALGPPRRSCSSLKKKSEFTPAVKAIRKKKIRSDAGDRRLRTPSSSSVVNFEMSLQNITNTDASNLRSNLKKSLAREHVSRDVFEDVAAIKLKRRNSEPLSFRGYIWKCADFPRSHKASVSSMASSLRHLNTDEIDDFILWEAVPQKMTSCWEMSLYHSRRPWSVLSCSVFKDNRKSCTPGLILENLRNQGINTRRLSIDQSERVNNHKQNPFDVEPSIAQKNIDIRNWLAALNFSTLPSTSNDIFSEGNCPMQSAIDPHNLNTNQAQANPKRRKVLPNLKFSDESSDKKLQDKKFKKATEWDENKDTGLANLIRRNSGSYVTKEQHLNSDHSIRHPNVTVNLCVYSKSTEESSIVVETNDKSSSFEPRKYKSVEVTSQPEVSISATIIGAGVPVGDQIIKKFKNEKRQTMAKKEDTDSQFVLTFSQLTIFVKRFVSDGNIWKYLFISTLFFAVAHYCFLKVFVCHN